MNKASLFTVGSMTGIILVLFAALLVQQNPAPAYGQAAMGDPGSGIVVATGGLLSSTNDLFWVLYKRMPTESEKKLLGKSFEGERLTLCTYRAVNGAPNSPGRVVLISARDISWDVKLFSLDAETKKNVNEIREAYDKAVKEK